MKEMREEDGEKEVNHVGCGGGGHWAGSRGVSFFIIWGRSNGGKTVLPTLLRRDRSIRLQVSN